MKKAFIATILTVALPLCATAQFSEQMQELGQQANQAKEKNQVVGKTPPLQAPAAPAGPFKPTTQLQVAPGANDLSLEMAAFQVQLIYNHCASKDRFFKQRQEPNMAPARVLTAMTAITPDFEVLDVGFMTEEHLYAPAVQAIRDDYRQRTTNFKNSIELEFVDVAFCSKYEPFLNQTNQVLKAKMDSDKLYAKASQLIKKVRAYPAFARTDFRSLPLQRQ